MRAAEKRGQTKKKGRQPTKSCEIVKNRKYVPCCITEFGRETSVHFLTICFRPHKTNTNTEHMHTNTHTPLSHSREETREPRIHTRTMPKFAPKKKAKNGERTDSDPHSRRAQKRQRGRGKKEVDAANVQSTTPHSQTSLQRGFRFIRRKGNSKHQRGPATKGKGVG